MVTVNTDGVANTDADIAADPVASIVAAFRFMAAVEKAEELGLTVVAEILETLMILPLLDDRVLDVFTVLTGADA